MKHLCNRDTKKALGLTSEIKIVYVKPLQWSLPDSLHLENKDRGAGEEGRRRGVGGGAHKRELPAFSGTSDDKSVLPQLLPPRRHH